MKTFYSFIFTVLLSITMFYSGAEAQVQGIKAIPSTDYPTIQSAFDSLNVYGVGSGGSRLCSFSFAGRRGVGTGYPGVFKSGDSRDAGR